MTTSTRDSEGRDAAPDLESPQTQQPAHERRRGGPLTSRTTPGVSTSTWSVGLVSLLVAIAFVSLVAAGLNGSSIGWLRNGQPDSSLVLGEPRPWRSDEWGINTPSSIGNDRSGLPDDRQLGLTDTEVATAVLAGPSLDWVTVMRPQDWGYVLLSPERGLAWHWWSSFALSLIGLMALFRAMRVSPIVSAGLSVMGTFSPYTGVFTSPSTALFLGFGGLAVGAAMGSLRSRSMLTGVLWGLLAAWSAVALVVVLYPPWTVSVGLIAFALVVGLTIDNRFPWRRVGLTYGIVLAATGITLALFYVTHRAAITASADTIYPGQRHSVSGDMNLGNLLGGPLHPWILTSPVLVPEVSSAWIPAGVVLVAVVFTGAHLVSRRVWVRSAAGLPNVPPEPGPETGHRPLPFTTLMTAAVTLLLLAWAFLPLPLLIGKLTQLERVQPNRLHLAFGLLTLVWLALVSRRRPARPLIEAVLWVAGVGLTIAGTLWARHNLGGLTGPSTWRYAAASAAVLSVGAVLLVTTRTRVLGFVVLSVYCFGLWALVNPLYRGLGALADEPVVVSLEQQLKFTPHLRVVTLEEPPQVGGQQLAALANASGADVLSGSTHYPDRAFMERFAPGQDELWNNYAWYLWIADPTADHVRLTRLAPDALEIRINPCGESAKILAADLYLSDRPLTGYACLVPQPTVPWNGTGRTIYPYQVAK